MSRRRASRGRCGGCTWPWPPAYPAITSVPPVPASLTESASGSYGADLPALRPGQWEVHLVVRRGAELYQYAERIVLR